jgi:hypothetical protein
VSQFPYEIVNQFFYWTGTYIITGTNLKRGTSTAKQNYIIRRGIFMRELVGSCQQCGKEIFCLDGFLNGVNTRDGKVLCFDCEKDVEESMEAK